jgi:hypothetical protein
MIGNLQSWTSTGYFSNSTDSYVTNCRFSPIIGPKSKGRHSPKCLHGNTILTKATDSWRKFGSDRNGIPNYNWKAVKFFSYLKKKSDILVDRLEGLFWAKNKAGYSFFLWTLGLAFGGFTLCPAKGSNSYIRLTICSPYFWTLNKVWPFDPTASRPGRP